MLTLLYHNILTQPADGLPVAGNQVRLDVFAEQLSKLRHRLRDPRDVHADLIKGRRPSGVLITFDDGAAGLLAASRALAAVGAVGVVFICPGALRDGLWFYQVADVLVRSTAHVVNWDTRTLPLTSAADRRAAYKEISRVLFDLDGRARAAHLRDLQQQLHPLTPTTHPALMTMTEDDVRQAASSGALIFANHSWSHPNLTTQDGAELLREIEAAHRWLQNASVPTLPWFAFPRGCYDPRTVEAVSAFCPVMFGAYAAERDARVLPRIAINSLDTNHLRFRIKTSFGGRLLGSTHLLRAAVGL
jgi:hypothetical protein